MIVIKISITNKKQTRMKHKVINVAMWVIFATAILLSIYIQLF